MVQAALLFWKNLTTFLKKQGYETNPYDFCVMNKTVDGKQCTVRWHVDDLKILHVKKKVVEDLVDLLNKNYGKEAPLTVTRGKIHDYLGMTIDYLTPRKVIFSMFDYIDGLLHEAPEDLFSGGIPKSGTAKHLFDVNEDATPLDEERAEIFHHLMAKLLYLCKHVQPNLQLPVGFLCTRVKAPDVDNWKKLGCLLSFLKSTKDDPFMLEATTMCIIKWWIDASFAVHPDFKSHTGAAMTLGKGCPINVSTKQKLNTRSLTEAELVSVDDVMARVIWTKLFIEHQGFTVTENVIYQDNQSAMLLEKNGKHSSGKNTRHIEIRYYFVTDNVRCGNVSIEYCLTKKMISDFHMKPTQGALYDFGCHFIMNLPDKPKSPMQEHVGSDGFDACRITDKSE